MLCRPTLAIFSVSLMIFLQHLNEVKWKNDVSYLHVIKVQEKGCGGYL